MVVWNLSVIEKFRQYLPYSHIVLIYDDKVGAIYHIRMSSSPEASSRTSIICLKYRIRQKGFTLNFKGCSGQKKTKNSCFNREL